MLPVYSPFFSPCSLTCVENLYLPWTASPPRRPPPPALAPFLSPSPLPLNPCLCPTHPEFREAYAF
eukprot:3053463-Pleurochrysis_carterae.AAC.1